MIPTRFAARIAALWCAALLGAALPAPAQEPPAAQASAPDKAGFVWVNIPTGEFSMGSVDGDGDEGPVHPVRVKAFAMAKTEVTHAQWRAVAGSDHPSFSGCDQCPVTLVSWEEAREFLAKASALLGEKLRLPTEAEWEYAARGGSAQQTWAGTNVDPQVKDYAWFAGNAGRKAHPACEKKPNLFGLCDMSGNVWEWCEDRYGLRHYDSFPTDKPTADPAGPAEGENRVLRGGSYASWAPIVRATQRFQYWPGAQTPYAGFRPAKSAP